MPSKFDSSIQLNDTDCAVSLLLNSSGVHALLAIERINSAGKYTLTIVDFLPAGVTRQVRSLDVQAAIKNPSDEGHVRIRKDTDAEQMTKADICRKYGLDAGEMLTWPCPKNKLADIKKRIRQDEAKPPKFELAGANRPYAEGFNCVTWAEDVLAVADIKPKLSVSTMTIDKTIAIPVYHIQGHTYGKSMDSLPSCSII